MLTLKRVNKALEAAGIPERLVKGRGYYYFVEGAAAGWPCSSILVYKLNCLTLEQWIRHHAWLREGAQKLRGEFVEAH